MTVNGIKPDFLIIGAMKAGTTTLYDRLLHHPQVGMSREKETDFFIEQKNWHRGMEWYQAQFRPGRLRYGEASPNYTKREAFPGVPERVAQTLPDAKFIFLARDPVARAVSQYRHAILSGVDLPLPAALPGTHHVQHLIDASAYARQLAPWLEIFPRDRFLFLQFEEMIHDPAKTLSKLAGFLAIDDVWPTAAAGASNTAESLSRLPPWLFRFRNTPAAAALKRVLPADLKSQLKSRLARGTPRQAPPLGPQIEALIRDALQDDSARFAAISGLELMTKGEHR
ncbi:MAG: sulfotransferase family protein [Rhodobacterales bacterium]